MATQPRYNSYSPPVPLPVKPNIRVVFSSGAAAVAANRAVAKLPAAVRHAMLDEIAIAEQAETVIEQARRSLTPECFVAFLKWGEAASACSTESLSDNENSRRLDVLIEALDTLRHIRSVGMSDLVFKTYLLALEATDSSCFGPMRETNWAEDNLVENLGCAAYHDIRNLDPLPDMLDQLGATGWRLSKSTVAFKRSVGEAVTDTFARAIACGAATASGVGQVMTWEAAIAAYRVADALCEATSIDHPEADARVDACATAMDYLIEQVRAPDLTALRIKLDLALGRAEGFEDVLFDDHAQGIITDIKHLAEMASSDPHSDWLAERNRFLLKINSATEGDLSDAECSVLNDLAAGMEARILQTPVSSERGLIAELSLLVQTFLEGHSPDIDECASVLIDARRVSGIGSLAAAANARHREMVA